MLTPLVRLLALKAGFVDVPRADRHHRTPTPYLGGVAVFLAMLLGLLAIGEITSGTSGHHGRVILLLVGAASLVLGLADDWRHLSPPLKFAGQVGITTLFLAVAGPGPTGSAAFDGVIGLFWIVGFMNAFNFLDNMDGVLAGVSFVAVLGLVGMSLAHGVTGSAWLLVLAGALFGFLLFNAPPARIFLGDAGSLFLGGIVSAAAWMFASEVSTPGAWFALPLILAYPLFDILFVTVTRLKRGQRPWIGGRDHTTHRLNTLLGGPRKALLVVYGLSVVGSLGAFAAAFSPGLLPLLPWWLIGLLFVGLGLRLTQVPVR
jgi:UDP-GlcNAc:undecaprenyl-phosphate GlcNAc-1-phosphate transferase